jgi:murein DD-endopeptidase MepM/ murein hydrolase activator NlpD
MKIINCIFLVLLFSINTANTQTTAERTPDGGGSYQLKPSDEISPAQRTKIIAALQKNVAELKQKGILLDHTTQQKPLATLFEWPLKQAVGQTDPGYYGISNYIDENVAYPNQLLDYNCGNRTYDLGSGYNHKGTDIFSWPYGWQKMNTNAVEVIAAAPGVIIGKDDGNFDQNCAFCTSSCNWNAVYIQHADGSIAWYGHMKLGSLTSKNVGATVTTGEYLGVMGSSGNSTGPHLHFEVYTNGSYTQLVDPWNGPCNSLNPGVSWWANQQPYRVSTLNKIMTHATPPQLGNCPADENPNGSSNFLPGNTVYFSSYYRDQLTGQTATHTIYRPDNSISNTWVQNFNSSFTASWWYNSMTLPVNAPSGVWRYQIQYSGSGQTVSVNFGVNTTLPLQLLEFTGAKNNNGVLLQWKTDNELNLNNFTIERSTDGSVYTTFQTVVAKNKPGIHQYQTVDAQPAKGTSYYRLKSNDFDGRSSYSQIVPISNLEGEVIVSVFPNPVKDLINLQVYKKANLQIALYNSVGQLILQTNKNFITPSNLVLNIATQPEGVYWLNILEKGQVIERKKIVKTKY